MKTPHTFYKEENKFYTLYTLQRAKKGGTLYGPTHGSEGGDKTICGIEADYNWWIKTKVLERTWKTVKRIKQYRIETRLS